MFQKLLKAEEIVKERERRNTFSRGSTTREFRQKPTHRAPAQDTNSTPAQREDNRPRLLEPLKNIKCYRCGRKGHVAKSCRVVVNQIGVEQLNKGQQTQHTEGTHVVCTQQNSQGLTNNSDERTHVWIRVLTVSNCEAANANMNANVIGSVYKVDVTINGVPTRALIDSGSQVCIIRQQLLPIIKEKCNWSLSECVARNLPLNTQPVGAEGSVLGATALVKLEVLVEVTGKCLEVPCYVIDSTKPVWQGNVKNCGMIMGTNALVAFQFCISHFNGVEISPDSLLKQGPAQLSKQICPPLTDTIKDSNPVQVDLAVQAPSLTELATLPKCTQAQLYTSQLPATELVIGSKKELTSLNKTFVVVLKHTVQIMLGITKWIDVQVQEQPSIIDGSTDVTPCSTIDTKESPEQCTEQSIGQPPCSDQSGQTWDKLATEF